MRACCYGKPAPRSRARRTVTMRPHAHWRPSGARTSTRAANLVPGREEYHVLLGHALVLQGEYTRAAAQLGPLVARAREPQIRDYARRLLGEISRAQNAEMDRARAVEARR